MKKMWLLLIAAVLTVSCGDTKQKQAAQGRNSIPLIGEISDDEEETENVREEVDALPLDGVDYVNRETGDKWNFVMGVSGDGTESMTLALFRGNGMQGYDMYEFNSKGNSRHALHEPGGNEEDDLQLYVYPGADSIQVTRDGVAMVFKTIDSFDEAVSGIDPDYTPARYAITAGENGGKWDTLESGEVTYTFPSGVYARSQWVKDGDKLYYVDVSGCRMLNNYAHDGFYAGPDGSWDKKVKCIDRNVLPKNGKVYSDESKEEWAFQLTQHDDGTIDGTARQVYPEPMNFTVNYRVKSFGASTYALFNVENEFESWHVCVLDGGNTIRVSGAGVTEVFR